MQQQIIKSEELGYNRVDMTWNQLLVSLTELSD